MNTSYIHDLPKEWDSICSILVAMGDSQRQRLLLAFEPGERLTAGQLSEASPLSRTTVSHHLKILRQSGVLGSEKIGKEVYYWTNRDVVAEALSKVLGFVQQKTPVSTATPATPDASEAPGTSATPAVAPSTPSTD